MSAYFSPTFLCLFILPWAPLLLHSSIYSKTLSCCAFYSNHQHYSLKDLCSFLLSRQGKLKRVEKMVDRLRDVSLLLMRNLVGLAHSHYWGLANNRQLVWQCHFFFTSNFQESLVLWCCVNPSACPEISKTPRDSVSNISSLCWIWGRNTLMSITDSSAKSQKIDYKISCWFILLSLLKLCLLKNHIAESMKY